VPILAENTKNRRGHDATQILVNQVGTALTLALVVVALLAWWARPGGLCQRARLPRRLRTSSRSLSRCCASLFPYIIFISLVGAWAAGILTPQQVLVPAFAPVLLNVAMIAARCGWPYFDPPVLALGWGVALVGAAVGRMLPHLLKIRMLPRPTRHFGRFRLTPHSPS